MGQYYRPVNITKIQHVYSHDFDAGMKLMEHSWIGNEFVGAVLCLLKKGGAWYKDRLVWAGDYGEKTLRDFGDSDPTKDVVNRLSNGDGNIFDLADDTNKVRPTEKFSDKEWDTAILINHTKKEYVALSKVNQEDEDGDWRICPLPLLCSDGNGAGGGDYRGRNEDLCGAWAGDSISVEFTIPQGFQELIPDFKE